MQVPPTPWQLLGAMLLTSAVVLALGRFEVAGPAGFDLQAWLAPWWGTAVLAVLVWWALPGEPPGAGGTPAWLTLWAGASLPANLVSLGLGIAAAQGTVEELLTQAGESKFEDAFVRLAFGHAETGVAT